MGNSISPYCPPFFSRWKREGGTRRQGLLYSHATTIEAFHVHESTCVPFCVAFRVSSKKRSYLFSSFFCSLREKIRHFLSLNYCCIFFPGFMFIVLPVWVLFHFIFSVTLGSFIFLPTDRGGECLHIILWKSGNSPS